MAKLGVAKSLVAIALIGGLLGVSSMAGAGIPPLTVTPTTVTYDEDITISGEGCSTQVVVGVIGIPGSQGAVTPEQDGSWTTTRSAPSEAGIPAGTLTVFASCLEPEFDYEDVEVTLTETAPTSETTATTAPATSAAPTTAAAAATASPRFTG